MPASFVVEREPHLNTIADLLRIRGPWPAAGLCLAALIVLWAAPALSAAPPPQAATQTVTDEVGRTVRIPQPVRRIVSLAPDLTETIFALGLGDRLVGDTDYCDYPAEALTKTRVGGPVNPNIEMIAALRPDLVLVSRSINRPASVTSLERLGIPVYATDPRSVEQVLASIERLGRLIGAAREGEALAAGLRRRLDNVRARLAGRQPAEALVVIWQEPLISVGRDTFLADALRWAGARSVVDTTQDWPNLSLEEAVRLQPDYLIFSSDQPAQLRAQLSELRERPGWRRLEALRENRVVILTETISRPSPRLVDAIEDLTRALHPDRVGALASPPRAAPRAMRLAVPGAA